MNSYKEQLLQSLLYGLIGHAISETTTKDDTAREHYHAMQMTPTRDTDSTREYRMRVHTPLTGEWDPPEPVLVHFGPHKNIVMVI